MHRDPIMALLLGGALAVAALGGCAGGDPSDSGDAPGDGGASDGGGSDGGAGDGGSDGGAGDGGGPLVISGSAEVRANEHNPFSALVTVELDHDAQVVVEYGEGAWTHQTPAVEVAADTPTDVLVLGLRADRDFQLRALASQDDATWQSEPLAWSTDPLPTGWPVCTPEFTDDQTGFSPDEVTCSQGVTSTGQAMYHCTDYWGEPVFAVKTDSNDSLMSMRPLRNGGWTSTSYTSSKLLFFDAQGAVTNQFAASWFSGQTRFEHQYVDAHEVIELTTGKWAGAVAFFTNAFEYFDDGDYKLGNGLIVFDLDSREVLYDYSFHGELGDQVPMDDKMPYTREGNGDYRQDWIHANTILHGADDDGREYFLLSVKSQDWIFKLYPDTDELAWALGWDGDFTLVDDLDADSPVERSPMDWAYHQHGMVFLDDPDGYLRLLMLDNGYPRHDRFDYRWDQQYSRIVDMRIDVDRGLADIPFEYGAADSAADDWFFSSTCGNTVMLPDQQRVVTLAGESATRIEVSYPEGEERWRMQCDTTDWCEYRVAWFPSLYELTWASD